LFYTAYVKLTARKCRVDRKRLSSWPQSCAGRSNQLSLGVVYSLRVLSF